MAKPLRFSYMWDIARACLASISVYLIANTRIVYFGLFIYIYFCDLIYYYMLVVNKKKKNS